MPWRKSAKIASYMFGALGAVAYEVGSAITDKRATNIAHSKRPTPQEALLCFVQRLSYLGFSPTQLDERDADARICGLIAGAFAYALNEVRLRPSTQLSDRERAILWAGAVATDAATQATKANFELAGMVMPLSLVDYEIVKAAAHGTKEQKEQIGELFGETVLDLQSEAFKIHNAIIVAGVGQDMAALIARGFMRWALKGYESGLLDVRREWPWIIELVGTHGR